MSLFRKSALFVFLGFALVTVALVWVLRSSIVGDLVESGMERMVGAKVDVEGLDIDLLGLSAEFDRIIVADKNHEFKNAFESGKGKFDISVMPVFAGKVAINELSLTNVAFGTHRTHSGWLGKAQAPATSGQAAGGAQNEADSQENSDGQIDRGSQDTAPASSQESGSDDALTAIKDKLPKLDLSALNKKVDISALTDPDKMASVVAIRKGKDDSIARVREIEKRFAEQTLEQDLTQLEKDYSAINVDKLDDVKQLQKAASQIQSLIKTSNRVQSQVKELTGSTSKDLREIKVSASSVKNLSKDDVDKIKALAEIGSLDVKDIGAMLFGASALDTFDSLMKYYNMASAFMGDSEEPEYIRGRGRDVHFKSTGPFLPGLLIKKVTLSGKDNESSFEGHITAINSFPSRYSDPIKADIRVIKSGTPYHVTALFDHRGNRKEDRIDIKGENVKLGRIDLGTSTGSGLPQYLNPNQTNINTRILVKDDTLDSEIRFASRKADFLYKNANPSSGTERNLREVFNTVDDVIMTASLAGPLTSPGLSVRSNLDNKLSRKLDALVGKKIKQTEKQIEQEVQKAIDKEVRVATKELEQYKKPVTDKLDNLIKKSDKAKAAVDKINKKIDDKLKSKLGGAQKKLENQLKDKLKGLKF